MALLPKNLDYTDKDFDALLARMDKLLLSVFPTWSDRNRANFGNILVELFCFVGDVLSKYLDNAANESRLVTATQRKSLLGLCKLLGYTPPGAGAASVDLTLSIPAPVAGDITLLAGDIVSTADVTEPVQFQLLTDALIEAGFTSTTVSVENSKNNESTFTSTGLADQEFTLPATPFLDDSALVVASDGAYVQVANFLDSGPTDKHYVVVVDQNDRARVRFGDGTNGSIPAGDLTVIYKTGGGAVGNVDPGAVKVLAKVYTDSFGTPVNITATNVLKADGGRDRASNARIKEDAPATLRAPTNCVAREDFEINAQRLSSVARALMLTSNEDPAVPENTGHLYIVPPDGGVPSGAVKDAVLLQVTEVYPCTLTFTVEVKDPVYKTVDVSVTAFRRPGYTTTQMKVDIETALAGFFKVLNDDGTRNPQIDFGAHILDASGAPVEQLAWSDIFDVVRDLPSVRKIDPSSGMLLNTARADVTLAGKEFPKLGTITVIDGDTSMVL